MTTDEPLPPQAIASERGLIGAMLLSARVAEQAVRALTGDEFYRPQHATIFRTIADAITAGYPTDSVALVAQLRDRGELGKVGGAAELFNILHETPTAANWEFLAEDITKAHRRRLMIEHADRLRQAAYAPGDEDSLLDVAARAALGLDLIIADTVSSREIPDLLSLDEFLAKPNTGEDFIIPDLVARGDVVLFLGGEGAGKSWVSRQIATCLPAGVHPFKPRGNRITPKRTLLVDLEVSEATLLDETRHIATGVARHGKWDGASGHVWHHPEGLNLRTPKDALLFEQVVARTRPDLICFGSLYNAYAAGRDSHEQVADDLKLVFNRIRTRYRCGLWLEHHQPKGDGHNRPLTAYGSSIWTRWATHGRAMVPINKGGTAYELVKFRGDRGIREFPAGLHRGGDLPVSPIWDEAEIDLLKEASK